MHVLLRPDYITTTNIAANERTSCLLKTVATTKEKRVQCIENDKTALFHSANVSRVNVHLLDIPIFHAKREDHRQTELEMYAKMLEHSMVEFYSRFHQI